MKVETMDPDFGEQTADVKARLARIRETVARLDSAGTAWEMRLAAAYRVFLASDKPRFVEEAVDIPAVARELAAVEAFLQNWGSGGPTERGRDGEADPTDTLDRTAYLYSLAWEMLNDATYLKAAELFSRRFDANGIDLGFIKGGECLDLGSGIGRNCKAMVDLGAARVAGIDLSPVNVARARERLAPFPVAEKIHIEQGNIYTVFEKSPGARFDFICCQGVIHHLEHPEKALAVISKMLKPGGKAFLYVFGEQGEGSFWDFIDLMRDLLTPVPIRFSRDHLVLMGVPDIKIYHVLDFGYVPFQHRFNPATFEKMLADNALSVVRKMDQGEIYDQNRRGPLYEADAAFFGDYDLRYLVEAAS